MTRAAAHHHAKPAPVAAPLRSPFAGLHHATAARLAAIAEASGRDVGDVREAFEERAAIRQFLAIELRDVAEEGALQDVEGMFVAVEPNEDGAP